MISKTNSTFCCFSRFLIEFLLVVLLKDTSFENQTSFPIKRVADSSHTFRPSVIQTCPDIHPNVEPATTQHLFTSIPPRLAPPLFLFGSLSAPQQQSPTYPVWNATRSAFRSTPPMPVEPTERCPHHAPRMIPFSLQTNAPLVPKITLRRSTIIGDKRPYSDYNANFSISRSPTEELYDTMLPSKKRLCSYPGDFPQYIHQSRM